MNDNYYPKDQIVLTEIEKEQFLANLPSIVSIDQGIKSCVDTVNAMPYFLTQSSCEGQTPGQPLGTHMELPYLSIGVLYNAFSLLDELADFLWVELKGKIFSMSIDGQVQAINIHNGVHIPNFQKYLSIFMKNKRGIALLEQKLMEFAQKPLQTIETDVEKMKNELAEKYEHYLAFSHRLSGHEAKHSSFSVEQLMQGLVADIKDLPSLSTVTYRRQKSPMSGFPEALVLEFYVKDDDYVITDLLELLCSFLTGGLIANQQFQATSSGSYLRKVSLSLFDHEQVRLFVLLVEHWARIGRWDNSPYWR